MGRQHYKVSTAQAGQTWEIIFFDLLVRKLPLGAGLGSSPRVWPAQSPLQALQASGVSFLGVEQRVYLVSLQFPIAGKSCDAVLFWFNLCYLCCMVKKNEKSSSVFYK